MVQLKKSLNVLNTAIIAFTAASLFGGAFYFIKNNIWRPKVSVVNVDYDKGVADINIGGKTKRLYINSTLAAGGDWGVRFGTITLPDGSRYPNRIELIRKDLVYETIAKTDVINVTG